MRNEFKPKDKILLAQRSGYICSYPTCEALTIAPNEENTGKTSSVGMACHIYAAADGNNAKRVNTNMTDEEISDISNGIWMCYTHGKLIDTDEVRFTPLLLREWKDINEKIASRRQELGVDYLTALKSVSLNKLISNKVKLPAEYAINMHVGQALDDSCVALSWGREITDTVRDFLIEHIRNAYGHGDAKSCTLQINGNEIIIIDDGSVFDVRSLYNSQKGRGGCLSIKRLIDYYGEKIFLSSYRKDDENILKLSLPKTVLEITNATPCSVDINMAAIHKGDYSYQVSESCNEIFIIFPNYLALSDIACLKIRHPQIAQEKKHLVFILPYASAYVKEILNRDFENCQIMMLNER
ncbi:hypothetical protein [Pantoea ananatis]|uniref:hypothetical protein n=1 Tax=Pantoea ananas TaxID=553 RepID=UPI001B304426|nr:hypothetical protein [Pantoea ananatis]